MRRQAYGWGYNLPQIIGLGVPSEPTGFVAKYTAYLVDNFILVTDNSINVWADESVNNNDLTQATSANQPKLVEDFTVTQFTASNQPTFVEGYEGTGAELVTNGDFSTDSDWTKGTGWSISGGSATYSGNNGTSALNQPSVGVIAGTKYLVTVDVLYNEGTGTNPIDIGIDRVQNTHLDAGIHEFTYTATASTGSLLIYARDGETFEIGSISVKEAVANPALDKLDFDTGDFMEGLKPQSGDFTYIFTGLVTGDRTGARRLLDVTSNFKILTSGVFNILTDASNVISFGNVGSQTVFDSLVLTRQGTNLSVYIDDVLLGSNTSSDAISFGTLGSSTSINGTLQSLEIYDVAVADVTNITETPVQTLTADPLKMRTSANLNPTDGQDVAKWYADEFSAYRDARVVFDTNDNMEGLPVQTGDFTYVFTGVDIPNYLSINSRFIGQLGASTARFLNVSGTFRVNNDSNIAIFNEPWNNESEIAVRLSGNTLSVFAGGVQLGSDTDVTGSTFTTLTTLGNSASSFQGEDATLNVFDRALTQTEIDYYSYLRSETGDILTNAQGEPLLPAQIYNMNLVDLNGVSQYYDLNNALQYGGSISFGGWMEGSTQEGLLLGREETAGGSSGGYILYTTSGGTKLTLGLRDSSNVPTTLNSTLALPTTGMNHVYATYDGTTMKVFINGALAGSMTQSNALGNGLAGNDCYIGYYPAGADILRVLGQIGMISFYDKALSDSDIADLAQNPTKCLTDLVSDNANLANPKLWVRLGDWNGNTADRLTNFGTDSITITPVNTLPHTFSASALQVECSP